MGLSDWTVIKTWIKSLCLIIPILCIAGMIMAIIYYRGKINELETRNKSLQKELDTPKQTVIQKPKIKIIREVSYVPSTPADIPNTETYEDYIQSIGSTKETIEIDSGQALEPEIQDLIDLRNVEDYDANNPKIYIGANLDNRGWLLSVGMTKPFKYFNVGLSFTVLRQDFKY